MNGPENDAVTACLARSVKGGASSRQIAELIATSCHAIDTALAPIIGHRGVAALYKRSLHLAARSHVWLASPQEGVPNSIDLEALTSVLAQRSSAEAAAAGGQLLQTFHDLLTTLIGPSLTEQLLRSAWAPFLSGSSAQDTTP
jgi:hypothetical protein